jgi:hypothetical protein
MHYALSMSNTTAYREKKFTSVEALTVMRFFVRLEGQITRACEEKRDRDCESLCRLFGALQYRIFGVTKFDSRSPMSEEVAA